MVYKHANSARKYSHSGIVSNEKRVIYSIRMVTLLCDWISSPKGLLLMISVGVAILSSVYNNNR